MTKQERVGWCGGIWADKPAGEPNTPIAHVLLVPAGGNNRLQARIVAGTLGAGVEGAKRFKDGGEYVVHVPRTGLSRATEVLDPRIINVARRINAHSLYPTPAIWEPAHALLAKLGIQYQYGIAPNLPAPQDSIGSWHEWIMRLDVEPANITVSVPNLENGAPITFASRDIVAGAARAVLEHHLDTSLSA